ncbi:amidase [Lichenihabitans sp. Uapishka_5]|uniref:amidase n=1 Tax=Lichenihabitans sp. Uapishka_5 TaxID=3037302 RepID=UPI0029E7DA08|nr:amidase [Lichenihabitans sp. Uapishka_5]MDX7950782.1 amidase [Lichenihabitans sp. Uapishka_5]
MTTVAPSGPIDLVEMTVEKAQRAFADGTMTAEALTQACLNRIETYNPAYNAIIFMNPEALADARAIDKRRAAGEALGPLAGIPVVVKDPMDMVGFPTTAGWRLLYSKTGGVDLMPGTDSPVVARMRAADTVILGKTNVPVLSHTGAHANDSWAGPTFNAAGREFLPGGSSAGTATAVAASMAVLGLAEETGGSIQNPASAQGLVGIKPTFALVPNAGVMPLSSNRDVVGPIARCVRDAALCLDVLAGYTIEDPKTIAGIGKRPKGGYTSKLKPDALQGKRLGLYGPGWRDMPLSTETEKLYTRAQGELRAQGAVLVDDPFANSGFAVLRQATPPLHEFDGRGLESVPYDLEQYLKRMGPNVALKTFAAFAAATAAENAFGPKGVLGFMPNLPEFGPCLADPTRPPDLSGFVALKEAYLAIIEEVFARHNLDVLVFPQMREPLAALHSGDSIHETTVGEINIAGLPGVTMPAGTHGSGAPFCLIFVGRHWSEADLLAYAYAYETATTYRRAPILDVG